MSFLGKVGDGFAYSLGFRAEKATFKAISGTTRAGVALTLCFGAVTTVQTLASDRKAPTFGELWVHQAGENVTSIGSGISLAWDAAWDGAKVNESPDVIIQPEPTPQGLQPR